MIIPLSIVITTYNREVELRRCLESILAQNYAEYEVIIVDDYSQPNYKDAILKDYPSIKYIYQEINSGPGKGRNRGIQEAKYNYVIIMDDDDVFVENAFDTINKFLINTADLNYPVFQFLRSNAKLNYSGEYRINSFKELLEGAIVGDSTPVINKEIFYIKEGYQFPDSRIGAELLLWFKIALNYGYPIINKVIVESLDDADDRLTNYNYQIKRVKLFKQYQIDILNNFEKDISQVEMYSFLINKYRGVITYALIEGDRKTALKYLFKSLKYSKKQLVFLPLILFPKLMITKLFLNYRT